MTWVKVFLGGGGVLGIEKSLPVAVLPLCAESLGKGMD